MTRDLFLENFGKTSLLSGLPTGFSNYLIPAALPFHAKGPWGILCLQELKTPTYLLKHFIFSLKQSISFLDEDGSTRLQSLLTINGHFDFEIKDQEKIELKEKEYLLFTTSGNTARTTAHKGNSSLVNAHYASELYRDFIPYFNGLKNDLRKALKKPSYFQTTGKTARPSVNDAIKAIWQEKYLPALQVKHIELRLESSLFTLLAQSYQAEMPVPISPLEEKLAVEAKKIILQNISVHLTQKEIALQLNCSVSWLRKSFRKVHGIPMFRFLRARRMHYAREQILNGISLKAVSIELGMNPSNFPKEFKAFFGYTVTSLKKDLH